MSFLNVYIDSKAHLRPDALTFCWRRVEFDPSPIAEGQGEEATISFPVRGQVHQPKLHQPIAADCMCKERGESPTRVVICLDLPGH